MRRQVLFYAQIYLFFYLINSHISYAADTGTRDEAVTMVKQVIKMYRQKGPEKTHQAVKDGKTFRYKDLYAFIINMEGVMVAHGVLDSLNGKNLIELQDGEGKYLIRAFVDLLKLQNSGWVDYKWPSPATKKLSAKSSYVERIDKQYFVGVGINRKISDN